MCIFIVIVLCVWFDRKMKVTPWNEEYDDTEILDLSIEHVTDIKHRQESVENST